MSRLATSSIVRKIESLFDGGSIAGWSDRELLERFYRQRDATGETAFAVIVARHGPVVLHVCRQLLGNSHDAEDAFQAVFFVLARKADRIRDPDLLGNWLYGVAIRTARKAKAKIGRSRGNDDIAGTEDFRSRSSPANKPMAEPADQPLIVREEAEVLHNEINRLPSPFRETIVLCDLEELTLDEAARRLRCPAGTLRSRLARARDKLRRCLTRRGFALPAVALSAMLQTEKASAAVSTSLCDITAKAAINFAAGTAAVPAVAMLARQVLRAMLVNKLKLGAVTCLLLVAVAAGARFVGQAPAPQAGKPDLPIALKADDAEGKPGPGRMFVVGRVLDPQGKPVPGATVMVYARSMIFRPAASEELLYPKELGWALLRRIGPVPGRRPAHLVVAT